MDVMSGIIVFYLGQIGQVQNVVVNRKLLSESTAVIISWSAPNQTNGQNTKLFQYLVKYCSNETQTCTNTSLSSATFVEITGLSSSHHYTYMIFVFDSNMVHGSTFNGFFMTAARGGYCCE